MLAVEHIGFTKSNDRAFITDPDMNVYPKDMSGIDNKVDIGFDRNNLSDISESFYFFYKVTGAKGLKLDLSWNNVLSNGNKDKDIEYSVIIHDGSPWADNPDKGWTHWSADIPLSTEYIYEANLYKIDLTVLTPIDASFVSDKPYTSEFTLSISAT